MEKSAELVLKPPISSFMSSTENVGLAERVFGTRMFFSLINFQGYTPNNACALAAGVIYGIIGVALLLRVIMSKAWWGLCLPIGAFCETASHTFP